MLQKPPRCVSLQEKCIKRINISFPAIGIKRFKASCHLKTYHSDITLLLHAITQSKVWFADSLLDLAPQFDDWTKNTCDSISSEQNLKVLFLDPQVETKQSKIDSIHTTKYSKALEMAALPQFLAQEEVRRTSCSSIRPANLSHGRGGAGELFDIFSTVLLDWLTRLGNIGTSPHDAEPFSLDTPTLKSDVYTTGRGGSGNMTKNTDPESARRVSLRCKLSRVNCCWRQAGAGCRWVGRITRLKSYSITAKF